MKFAHLLANTRTRNLAIWRHVAILHVTRKVKKGMAKERALRLVCKAVRSQRPGFKISARSLRYWQDRFEQHGIDGLVEQKRGHCGRRPLPRSQGKADVLFPDSANSRPVVAALLSIFHALKSLLQACGIDSKTLKSIR